MHIMMLNTVDDDILCDFNLEDKTRGLLDDLYARFGFYKSTKLRMLNIKFDFYKMNPQNSVKQH